MAKRTLKASLCAVCIGVATVAALGGCAAQNNDVGMSSASSQAEQASAVVTSSAQMADQAVNKAASAATPPTAADIETTQTFEDATDGGHAITADGEQASYEHVLVKKTGEASGDEADFYGQNSAVFATNGATLDLNSIIVDTAGTHANGVFSYGQGTTINIADSVISTTGNCSGGLMTTGGATMNATNLRIDTTGNSSAAIRSDRGGGTVTVSKGSYTTSGTGSPVIYSTADITVSDAQMESNGSQGVVVEGKNSVTLNNVDLVANNTTKNSDKSDYYQAVMIYQSMSGDAAMGSSAFTMNGGTLTNKSGDVFFVNNTTTTIDLTDASIVNEDAQGVFLRAAAAGWGTQGSNGGQVTLNAAKQQINGAMLVDEASTLNLYLKDGSTFTGSINDQGQAGQVYVEVEEGSTWVLTDDSYVTSLTCGQGAVNLNGHTLYVNGVAYDGESASTGQAIEVAVSASQGPEAGGAPPERPDGQGGEAGGTPPEGGPGGTPPEGGPGGTPPDGAPGGTPPERPQDAGEPPAKPTE